MWRRLAVGLTLVVTAVILAGCPVGEKSGGSTGQAANAEEDGAPAAAAGNQKDRPYRQGDAEQRRIALTFDDGPDPEWTPRVLDVLREKQVHATFFVIGREAEKYPDLVRRMVDEGHIIGNHSYRHANLDRMPVEQAVEELAQCDKVLAAITGKRPLLVRPPFGAKNPGMIRAVHDGGQAVILWSIDPEDWRGRSSTAVHKWVVSHARNGGIVLQHCGEGPNLNGSVEALPLIIDDLRSYGFELVDAAELLHLPAYE